ncbi:MAG TPA: TIGR02587 family membrane protein [Sphingomicrobium sp.]|nr:TIGR02587 family membrane protein [Sphingomicrobium sp.]
MAALDAVDFRRVANLAYLTALGRGFAGAILFSLPLLMTMEMWFLGFYLDRPNLVQFVLVNFIVLVGLARLSGFEPSSGWVDDVMDAFAAYAVAAIWSFFILWLLGIVTLDQPAGDIIGKVALESIPASFGAMLASKNLGTPEPISQEAKRARATYLGQLFLMLAGAIFVGFSVAPTEEMVLISFLMSPVRSIMLILFSIILLHGVVYAVGFRGQEKPSGPTGFWSIFLRFTIPGYAIAAATAFYLLWTFGRIEGTTAPQIAAMVAVLAFPGAVGAALARLVV